MKRFLLILLLALLTALQPAQFEVNTTARDWFRHYASSRHIARLDIVYAADVAADDTVEYIAVQPVGDVDKCISRLRRLPVLEGLLMPKAARRVREQTFVLCITYNDGCRELVDAAARAVWISPECSAGAIHGRDFWHDGGPVVFEERAFDELVRKYLPENAADRL